MARPRMEGGVFGGVEGPPCHSALESEQGRTMKRRMLRSLERGVVVSVEVRSAGAVAP